MSDIQKSEPMETLVMTRDQIYARALSEHIDNNAEALKRLMLLIAETSPTISHLIANLTSEWHEINHQINAELRANLKSSAAP